VATAGLLASIFDLHGGLFSFLKYLAVAASVLSFGPTDWLVEKTGCYGASATGLSLPICSSLLFQFY